MKRKKFLADLGFKSLTSCSTAHFLQYCSHQNWMGSINSIKLF